MDNPALTTTVKILEFDRASARSNASAVPTTTQSHPVIVIDQAAPAKRKRGKSLSRRTGQDGHIEKSGRWFVVRFWRDIPGQEQRAHVRERVCPISGPGLLSKANANGKREKLFKQADRIRSSASTKW